MKNGCSVRAAISMSRRNWRRNNAGRADVPISSRLSSDLVETNAGALAAVLVAEWEARHAQGIPNEMVKTPSGLTHPDSAGIHLGQQDD